MIEEKVKDDGTTDNQTRIVVVRGPKGFDCAAALFAMGVELNDRDVVIARERPGNVEVELIE